MKEKGITLCMKWICTVVDEFYFADAEFVYLNKLFMCLRFVPR